VIWQDELMQAKAKPSRSRSGHFTKNGSTRRSTPTMPVQALLSCIGMMQRQARANRVGEDLCVLPYTYDTLGTLFMFGWNKFYT